MKAPWHLWLIGIVTLLWNAGGLYDFLMTNWNAESYLAHFTPEQQSYFADYPTWLIPIWGDCGFRQRHRVRPVIDAQPSRRNGPGNRFRQYAGEHVPRLLYRRGVHFRHHGPGR